MLKNAMNCTNIKSSEKLMLKEFQRR
jgi:hypothetical protein